MSNTDCSRTRGLSLKGTDQRLTSFDAHPKSIEYDDSLEEKPARQDSQVCTAVLH